MNAGDEGDGGVAEDECSWGVHDGTWIFEEEE